MATGLWGSICLQDFLEGAQVAQAPDGSVWVNLGSLPQSRFKRSDRNGKIYAGINIWINDELDEYQNAAAISFQQSQDERNRQEKRKYIGNLRYVQSNGTAQSPGPQTPAASTPWGNAGAASTPRAGGFGAAPAGNQNTGGFGGFGAAPQNNAGPQPVTQQDIANGANASNGYQPVNTGAQGGLPF